ncbi:MAG: MBOAT family protein [Cyanobacteria bacterium J06635_15]
MIFNSIEFAIFVPIVFGLYWAVPKNRVKTQNALLLLASYIFYGWWDWRFLSLIAFSSFLDYSIGLKLANTTGEQTRKIWLLTSLLINLGFLGCFKYFDFFAESLAEAFTLLGKPINPTQLGIILPIGISFYTFQTLSYSIDVYRRQLKPTKDIIEFFSFVSFFPQLVSGPIERATHLLPQFQKKRSFDYAQAVDGMRQILWGLFKKIVIADNSAVYANDIFSNYTDYSGSTLLLGAIFFTFQIYGDFSGYSDIAIGTARLFGFDLKQNFAFPYFSQDIAEFWRRWHISLSTWFRDYVYIPLGGSRGSLWMKTRNTFIIFLISGLWHGANWTFVIWGLIHACYFLPLILLKQNRRNIKTIAAGKVWPNINEFLSMGLTFSATVLAWIFFRAETVSQAVAYVLGMFTTSLLSLPEVLSIKICLIAGIIIIFLMIEWVQREKRHALQLNSKDIPKPARWALYWGIVLCIIWLGGNQQNFIYFQF